VYCGSAALHIKNTRIIHCSHVRCVNNNVMMCSTYILPKQRTEEVVHKDLQCNIRPRVPAGKNK
jgi:hypothetical protein